MTDSAGNSGAQLLELRVDMIKPWPRLNPRKRFGEEALAELTASVKEKGVLEPLLVHESVNPNEGYLIVAGERRWRAAKAAGIKTVPCIVRKFSRAEALEVAIVENLQRSDITAIEEARGFADWLGTTKGTQKDLAQKIGRTQPYVSNRVRILALPDGILELLEDGVLDYTAARDELVPYTKVQPEAAREKFFKALEKELRGNWHGYLGQSIRTAIEKVARPNWTYAFHHRQMGMDAIHVDREDHEGCGCHSPVAWACFDVEAWEKRNEAAKARKAEQVEEDDEEGDEDRLEAVRDRLAKLPIVSDTTLQQELDGDWQAVTTGTELKLFLDPRDLPPERLVWGRLINRRYVEEQGWKDVEYVGLVCLDWDLADAAVKGGQEEFAERVAALRRQRTQQEREEAARGSVTAEVLRAVFLAEKDHLFQVLKDLRMVDFKDPHWWAWNDRAEDLEKLSKIQLEVVAKVLHIRREGGYLEEDPLPGMVRRALEAEYQAALEEILPPLPEGVTLDDVDEEPAEVEPDTSTMEDVPEDVEKEPVAEAPGPGPAGVAGDGGEEPEAPVMGPADGSAAEEGDPADEAVPEFEDGEVIGDGPFAIRQGTLRTIVYDTRTGETVGGRVRERDARRYAEQKNAEAEAEAVTA